MAVWLPPRKAAEFFKKSDCNTVFREKTIRNLIRNGFPHITNGNRKLINVERFEEDLKAFVSKR